VSVVSVVCCRLVLRLQQTVKLNWYNASLDYIYPLILWHLTTEVQTQALYSSLSLKHIAGRTCKINLLPSLCYISALLPSPEWNSQDSV
jgi:hypothetical protein